MINLTPVASTKVKEIMSMQSPVPAALRVAVVGGGCSGFQYHMAFENQTSDADQVFEFDGLKVAVDQMSSMYLDGIEIDYIETVVGKRRALSKTFFGLLSGMFRSLFYAL
jgi:iron-sulfur cluster assembly protein